MEIILIDLFSGIGGFSLGFKQAGFKITNHYFSEVDKHAIANYKYNFKDAEYIGSVTDVSGHDIRKRHPNAHIIVTFGSPCQDFSVAGKRKGIEGERSSLIMEAIRVVSETQPSVFLWENVKGTFSSNDGADFWAILNAFTNIGNYRLEWQLLNTSWVLPQNRERIYLAGHLAGRSEPGLFPITENDRLLDQAPEPNGRRPQAQHCATLKASGTMKADDKFIATTLNVSSAKMVATDTYVEVIPVATPARKEKKQNGQRFKPDNEPMFSLTCQDTHGVMISSATKKGYEVAQEGDAINFSVPKSETRRGRVGKGVAQTLDTACNQGVISYSRDAKGKVVNRNIKEECNTVTASTGGGGNTDQFIIENTQIRRLTEIECERLQGFPDNWTQFGDYEGQVKKISKTQRYKMCGNAVTATIVKIQAQRLKLIN